MQTVVSHEVTRKLLKKMLPAEIDTAGNIFNFEELDHVLSEMGSPISHQPRSRLQKDYDRNTVTFSPSRPGSDAFSPPPYSQVLVTRLHCSISPFTGHGNFSQSFTLGEGDEQYYFSPDNSLRETTTALTIFNVTDDKVTSVTLTSEIPKLQAHSGDFGSVGGKTYELDARFELTLNLQEASGCWTFSLPPETSIKISGKDALLGQILLNLHAYRPCTNSALRAEVGLKTRNLFQSVLSGIMLDENSMGIHALPLEEKKYLRELLQEAVSITSDERKVWAEHYLGKLDSAITHDRAGWGLKKWGIAITATLAIGALTAMCAFIPPVGALVVGGVALSSPIGMTALGVIGLGVSMLGGFMVSGVKKMLQARAIKTDFSRRGSKTSLESDNSSVSTIPFHTANTTMTAVASAARASSLDPI